MTVVHFLAAADVGGGVNPVDYFQQYGVLGAVVICLILGWLVPGWWVKQLSEENKRLTMLLEEKVIPMTSTYAATMERCNSALEKAAQAIEKMNERHDHDIAAHRHQN